MSTTERNLPAPRVVAPELDVHRAVGRAMALASTSSNSPDAEIARGFLRSYYAEELGLGALAAGELSFISGKLVISVNLQRALAERQGYRVVKIDSTDESCTVAVVELATGEELGRYTYTMEDAKRAGDVKEKGPYKTHPARMLWHRAAGFALDDYAPHVTLGLLTEEAADEIQGDAAVPPRPEAGGATAESEPASVPPEHVEDAEWSPVDEGGTDATTEALAMAEVATEHRRLAVKCKELDENPQTPTPEGYESWEAFSRWLAGQMFPGVTSRSELDAEQLRQLHAEVDSQSIPF